MTDVLLSRSSSPPEAPALVCRAVLGPAELAEHHAIRREVFVAEQALFTLDDRDDHDEDPATVHLLGLVHGRPAGTVRLYPFGLDPLTGDRLWKGDRLAVRREHRRSRIGGPLVRLAAATAGAGGGTRMVASVQAANARFFQHLGWTPVDGPFDLLGCPHQRMTIPLQRPT